MKFSREFYFRAVLLQLKARKNKIVRFLKDIF